MGPALSHHWQPGPVCPSPQGHCPLGPPLLVGVTPDCHYHSSLSSEMQLGLGWRPWDGVDQRVRRREGTRSTQTTSTTSQGRPTHPTFQEPPLNMERQTEVIQGGWGWEVPSLQTGQPSSGPMEFSRVRVGLVGWATPKAYPVLGEEPCRDTAYVLGMAEPAWCSRCGPPRAGGKGREAEEARG